MGSKFLYLVAVALVVGGLNGGVDVRVNQDNLHILQNEPSITINPGLQNNIVVAYNEAPGCGYGLGISYSGDGGVTWNDNQIGPIWGIEGDPSADADLSGNVFVGFMSYRPNFFTDTNGIYVAVSGDGGMTWPTITAVDLHTNSPQSPGHFTDKPYLCVDNYPSSPFKDYVYIAWQRDNPNGVNADVYFAASYNAGTTFTTPQKISDLPSNVGQCVGQVPKAAPNGDVFVTWADYGLQGHCRAYLYIDKSSDSGATWGTDVLIDSFIAVPRYPNLPNTSFYVRSYPTIGVSPMNSNDVYVAIAADPDGVNGPDDGDIYLWASHDGGQTWNGPVRVNDDNTYNDQFQPWLDVKPNGIIDIVWIDRRNDPNDWNFEVYFAYSTDGGASFSPNVPISDMPYAPPPSPNSWMGEYIGIDVDNTYAYIVWTDTRLQERDIYFDTMENPPTGTEEGTLDRELKLGFNGKCLYVVSDADVMREALIRIFDVSGRAVLDRRIEVSPGETFSLDLTHSLHTGVYFAELKWGGGREHLKFMFLR